MYHSHIPTYSRFLSVNSIFNPGYVDCLYPTPPHYRQNLLAEARATNYGVVRLELIEQLYERMYDQRREFGANETRWPHRILGGRRVLRVEPGESTLRLELQHDSCGRSGLEEGLDVDLVIAATGYQRRAHVDMLRDLWPLLPERQQGTNNAKDPAEGWEVELEDVNAQGGSPAPTRVLQVGRDYRVQFLPNSIGQGSGIWLQGCCESTHGVSTEKGIVDPS